MLVKTTYRMQEMSRDAYMDIGGRATQDAKAEDRAAQSHPCNRGISTSVCVSP